MSAFPDESKLEQAVTRAYALIGMCAAGFSALEFHTQFLLGYLHNQKVLSLETIVFTRGSTFAEKLRLCTDFLRLRSDVLGELGDTGLLLVKDIDDIRDERNKFIHGYWLVAPILVAAGKVNVSDPRWTYNKTDNAYKAMDTTTVKLSELETLSAKIGSLISRLHKFIAELEKLVKSSKKRSRES